MPTKSYSKKLVIEIRRESGDGQVYSQIRDINAPPYGATLIGTGKNARWVTHAVVIDRAKGRMLDAETIQARACALAELLDLPFDIDLTWSCAALKGMPCRCPRCVNQKGVS